MGTMHQIVALLLVGEELLGTPWNPETSVWTEL